MLKHGSVPLMGGMLTFARAESIFALCVVSVCLSVGIIINWCLLFIESIS